MFSSAADSGPTAATRDHIVDFSSAEGDKLDFSAIDADGNSGNGHTAFDFIGTAAFSGHAGELRYGIEGLHTVLTADIDGDGHADLSVVLSGGIHLVAGDFVL